MSKIISKSKLIATTAICAISVCANTVKAEEISILDILNNSTTKSPNISWEQVTSAGENTIQIGDEYFKYIWKEVDITRDKYTEYQNNTLSDDIKADFININNEYIVDTGSFYGEVRGGAIYNIDNLITSIVGNFTNNMASSTIRPSGGGAIYNLVTILSITGDFTSNGVIATSSYNSDGSITIADAQGGAIYNYGSSATIETITGNFTGNNATAYYARGGAIYNGGTIGNITADFTNNYVASTDYYAEGGAIYSTGYFDNDNNYISSTISSINGDFIGNRATGNYAVGGAITNQHGTIGDITGDFIGNSTTSMSNNTNFFSAYGGAISNNVTINSVTGDFTNNSATSTNGSSRGGAIYNQGTISFITGDFINNNTTGSLIAWGGAIYNRNYGSNAISSITGDFIGNSATGNRAVGGAIKNGGYYNGFYEYGTISSITGDFIGNNAISTRAYTEGGAIHNDGGYDNNGNYISSTIETITGDFTGNSAISNIRAAGGAIYNNGTISSITGDFTDNSATGGDASGGAIDNSGTIETITGDFIGNYAKSADDDYARGGAIYNGVGTINFVADASDSEDALQDDVLFQGNYVEDKDGKRYEAIYNFGTINFGSRNGGSFTFYDSIGNSETINLTGDGKGIFNMYNNIENYGTINIKNPYTFNMVNQEANIIEQDYFNIEAASTLNLDVILSAGTSDRFNIYEITGADKFELKEINLVDDMEDGVEYEKIAYSNKTLTKESKHELSTSENVYSIVNDGQNLMIEKTDGIGGFAAFLANENNLGEERDYRFTKDEEMRHALIFGNDKTGYVQDKEAKLTILGNNKTLSGDGEILNAMNLKSGQTAEISNLTIKGFENGLINKGAMTLNNVTLTDNKVGLQNSGDISLQGENTISGSDYAMYFEAPKTYEYPLTGAFLDYMLAQEATSNNTTYEKILADLSSSVGANITNGAEFVEFLEQQGGMGSCTDDLSCVNEIAGSYLSISLTQSQYNDIIDVVKEYGEEHPGSGFMALMLISEFPDIPLSDMMAILYAEDTATQEALIDGFIEDMVTSGMISEDEKAYAKQEISTIVSGAQQESVAIDTMYADLSIPLPYDYLGIISGGEGVGTTLNFAEGAILNLNSKVSGADVYGLTLAGSDDAIINLNSEIEKADLVLDGPTLKLSDESTNLASVNSFEVKNGTLDMQNDVVRTLVASNFKVSGALKLYVDADLTNKTMDTLGEVEVLENGSISVDGIKILSDAAEVETSVEFAGESYKDKVTTTVDNVLSAKYTYAVEYDATTGEFKFVRSEQKAAEEVAPNQAPSLTTNTTVAAVETVVAQIFDRDVTISTDTNYGADTTDYMETSDGVNVTNDKSVWVKTFGSDDDVKVDNFNSTIDAESYGVVGGVDSKVFTYDNGVKAAYGVYGAYVGGKQKYNDSKITQDSGYLGVSAAFRKNNLFSNFTLNGGYITSEANTAWGKDKFDTKVVSVANKTGVDIKTSNGWTITPAMYVAYTGMDTEDYTNKAGVKMENEFANVITLAPELKVRKGFNNGVGAYAKASYKHYIYDSEVKADDVVLEEMSAKPYVEYGFGVEKNWADKSGYAELTRRDGGREGWNVNLGLRLNF